VGLTESRSTAQKSASLLRLRGPLASDPSARILNAQLLGLLCWVALQYAVFLPFFAVRKPAAAALATLLAVSYLTSLALLRSGRLRGAELSYLLPTWIVATILIYGSGGIHSPALVFYAALPISVAWLLGYRGALAGTILCLATSLVMVIVEVLGVPPPRYFSANPWPAWFVLLFAILIAALPVIAVLRALNESLALSRHQLEELHRAQEALRAERDLVSGIMETSPAGIVAFNRDGDITFTNAAGESILGLSRTDAVKRSYNSPEWRLTTFDGGAVTDENLAFARVRSSLRPVQDVCFALEQPGGRRVLLSVNAAPVFTSGGEFGGAVASIQDVTERRNVEAELVHYREHLEELVRQRTAELVQARDAALAANHAKSLFLANMSHELRTPLNAILGFASLMSDAPDTPDTQRGQLQIVTRCGEHLLELINEVLETAKIEAGGLSADNAPFDLDGLVMEIADMIRVRAAEKGLQLSLQKAPGVPSVITADAAKLRQILINLMGNAVKFTERGGIDLRLDSHTAGNMCMLTIEVADTGIGIASADQERIFQPFVQAGKTLTEGGTGLGLAICRQYAGIMGGSLGLESAPGKGSRFRVTLPVQLAGPADVRAHDAGSQPVIAIEPGEPEYRVLVVEDKIENWMLLERLLRGAGFQVRLAPDGAAAVSEFQAWHPHFIWMDWRLPVMDGREATKRIRALPGGRDVKIAAVTASVFDEERSAILSAGVDDFVRKPFRSSEIFDCMERHLGVKYVRGNRTAASPLLPLPVLSAELLQALPEELRADLANAVLHTDISRVTAAISRISEGHPILGAVLASHAARLAFTPILQAIRPPADTVRGNS